MPNINPINIAVYQLLTADTTLDGLCSIYKGGKRPSQAENPSVTVEAKRLEPGNGEGMWMCDIVVTAYAANLSNGMPDHEMLENIASCIYGILEDGEITLENSQALPLIRGDICGPSWNTNHDEETSRECIFGLIFVNFTS